jgi:glycosyltransferase involved in cell wall biosynthesis
MHAGRSPRIALFAATLGCGGAERMMIQLARGMAAQGVPLDLVVAQATGPLASEIPSEVRVVDLKAPRMRQTIWGLTRYLRRERPQAVLSRVLHANLAVSIARRLSGVPARIVLTEASNLSAVLADGLIRPYLATAARWLYPQANQLIAVSVGAARGLEQCLRLPAGRVRVIYNPVVDARLPQRAAEPAPHPWLAKAEIPVILSVGRLGPEKDHATLLAAVAIVRRTRPVRLLIFGEGSERSRLEVLRQRLGLDTEAAFPGITSNPYAAMSRASLFVLSSRLEGLPGALIEALACGCPVVSTDCPSGPAEILPDERYGLLVPVADPPALAQAILTALDRQWDRGTLVQRGTSFSLDQAVPQYLDALGYSIARLKAANAA